MNKLISIVLISLLFWSCNNFEEQISQSFFDFDEVIHYSLEESAFSEIMKKTSSENNDNKLAENVVMKNYPKDLTNFNLETELIELKYSSSIIDKSKHNKINSLFSESDCYDDVLAACAPYFRDVLIFKKRNQVIGVAKICFECDKSYIIGTEKRTDNFGECGKYDQLYELVK